MFYKNLRPKEKVIFRNASYINTLTEIVMEMFEYNGFPDSIDTNFLEFELNMCGMAAICNVGGKWIVAHVSLVNDIDEYGFGIDAIVHTQNGKEYTFKKWKTNGKIVIVKNNKLMRYDDSIERTADMLSEIDLSMVNNVQYSRYAPIMACNNDREKLIVENAYKQIKNGDPIIISTPTTDILTGQKKNIDVINYTDVSNSDKLQYLSSFYFDILGRWFMFNGMDIQGTSKVSQYANIDEVNGKVTNSFILPNAKLKERRKAIERFNAISGLSVSVEYSETWKMQLATAPEKVDEDEERGEDDAEIE